MKPFNEFMKGFEPKKKEILSSAPIKKTGNSTIDTVRAVIALVTAFDTVAEERLRAYHEWINSQDSD